jgi:SpoVK/Ycf46/Vps4 family AAA+-type ATPase
MAHQKPAGFISYKFRAIKTFASNEWLAEGKKKYRQVFDRNELSYLHVEFSFFNKLFDEEDWEAKILLKAYRRPKDRRRKAEEIGKLEVPKHISQAQNIVYVREQLGHEMAGNFWEEGHYLWEAYINGKLVGAADFYVYDVGPETEGTNRFLEVESVQLYEGANSDRAKEGVVYHQAFRHSETRFIWVRLQAKNHFPKEWMCEMIFYIYNDARQLKGQMVELVKVKADSKEVVIHSGWGSDLRGTWFKDNYTVEIVFMDTLIGIVPFSVGDVFETGDPPLIRTIDHNMMGQPGLSLTELDKMTLEEVLSELDAMIGLESVKGRIREYSQYLNFLGLRKEKGFEDGESINLHVVFTGNPGTGKTTVARMLGRIYRKLGLLSKGHIHEVDRADLIGEYIGQTAPKVKTAIEKARGGILFIDEAYSLFRGEDDTKDYGREVIELLVKEMSDKRGDLAIVVAGYPKEMELFLKSNPGLKSRFTMKFEFPDYTPDELEEIALHWTERLSVALSEEARVYLKHRLTEAYRSRDRSFGNARYVLSIINEAKMNLGLRVMKSTLPGELTKEDLSVIQEGDVAEIFEAKVRKKARIPIDENLLHTALGELNELIGLENVKNEIQELVKLVKFYKEIGKDVLNRFSLHTIFTGNPGTGKTTVARILGKIYKALGILERGHVVECDRQGLVAGFVGQTAIKTAEVVEKARGGVLFIDEAYALAKGGANDFGREAIETILKRMEDLRGELVVIAVGYPDNMRRFLEANPGLRSRFDRKMEFQDYNAEELLEIARMMLGLEEITMTAEAQAHLATYFKFLDRTKNKYFGNARAVRKVIGKAIKNQHLRLASLAPEVRTPEMLKRLEITDVSEFSEGNDTLLEGGKQGRVGF